MHTPTTKSPSPSQILDKVDKVLSKLTKEMCNICKSTTNILTHLTNDNFGKKNTTSVLPYYVDCISQQLVQALNDPRQLGIIYKGLTNYEGSLDLPKLKYQVCTRSPITITLYLLEKE